MDFFRYPWNFQLAAGQHKKNHWAKALVWFTRSPRKHRTHLSHPRGFRIFLFPTLAGFYCQINKRPGSRKPPFYLKKSYKTVRFQQAQQKHPNSKKKLQLKHPSGPETARACLAFFSGKCMFRQSETVSLKYQNWPNNVVIFGSCFYKMCVLLQQNAHWDIILSWCFLVFFRSWFFKLEISTSSQFPSPDFCGEARSTTATFCNIKRGLCMKV